MRIGVAQDRAFGFYYADTFDLLAELGAEVVPFSPLDDDRLPPALDGVYLGGGFPELYAREIAANVGMRTDFAHLARRRAPIYAECGGLMALGQEVVTFEGEHFAGLWTVARGLADGARSADAWLSRNRGRPILGAARKRRAHPRTRVSLVDR